MPQREAAHSVAEGHEGVVDGAEPGLGVAVGEDELCVRVGCDEFLGEEGADVEDGLGGVSSSCALPVRRAPVGRSGRGEVTRVGRQTHRVVGEPSVELGPAVRLPSSVHPRLHALLHDPYIPLALREARHEVVGVVPQDLEGLVEAQRAVPVCVSTALRRDDFEVEGGKGGWER